MALLSSLLSLSRYHYYYSFYYYCRNYSFSIIRRGFPRCKTRMSTRAFNELRVICLNLWPNTYLLLVLLRGQRELRQLQLWPIFHPLRCLIRFSMSSENPPTIVCKCNVLMHCLSFESDLVCRSQTKPLMSVCFPTGVESALAPRLKPMSVPRRNLNQD